MHQTLPESGQWIYTGGHNSEYLFVMGGSPVKTYAAKLDSKTLEVLQLISLPPALYLGGLLVHSNGNLYGVQGNRLFVFWNCDLWNQSVIKLSSKINSLNSLQTNGMIVTSDGYLVIKQWPYLLEDTLFTVQAIPPLLAILVTLWLYFIYKAVLLASKRIRNSVISVTVGICIGSTILFIVYTVLFSVLVFTVSGGPFNLFRFITKTGANAGTEIKIIHPITLEVVVDVAISERCSYGRMALSNTNFKNELGDLISEDSLILACEEFSRQFRWEPVKKTLTELSGWSRRYRRRGEGSFTGTGPAILNEVAYYTDNTFPLGLYGSHYSIFRQPLNVEYQNVSTSEPCSGYEGSCNDSNVFLSERLSPTGTSGVMFWSVVVSPRTESVLVWDTHGGTVQMRNSHDLSLRWTIRTTNVDCATIADDRKHVYFSDYKFRPQIMSLWIVSMNPAITNKMYPVNTKYLIVADTETGKILSNVSIFEGSGIKASLIVPGANNDLFVGTTAGISRIYV
jgi:hypothetical protein